MTAIGSTTGQSVVKGLRSGVPSARILGVDIHPEWSIAGSNMVDRFVRVPRADDPGYLPAIERLCKEHDVAAIFPVFDTELGVLARAEERAESWDARLWLSPPHSVAMANDKWKTHLFFRELGIDSPASWLPEMVRENRPEFPLVVKPRNGVSSRDVFIVADEHELDHALARVEGAIVQEYLDGPELTIDVTTDWDGEILGVVARMRVDVRSGLSYKGLTIDEPGLVESSIRIARAMNLRGPANIQCRRVGDTFRFFEINPRFSGTLPLSIAAGVNSPAMLWRSTLGEPVDRVYPEAGVYMARRWEEVYRHGICPDEL